MTYVKWTFFVLFWGLVASVLYYTLPRHDVVRLVNTEVRRVDFGENSIFWANTGTGDATGTASRDIYFIAGVRPGGRPRVYRNEDTGWIWPPYFKYDSANLHAEATNLRSGKADPQWVSVTAYGWRIPWLTAYPNAIAIDTLANPNDRPRNWGAMIISAVLLIFLVLIWRMWAQFRERTLDPAIRSADARWDRTTDRVTSDAAGARGRLSGWWNTRRARPRK